MAAALLLLLAAPVRAAAEAAAPLTATAGAGLLEPLHRALQSAALEPTLPTLALVTLFVAGLPLLVVVPMTAVCLAAAKVLPIGYGALVIQVGLVINTAIAWAVSRTVFGAKLEAWVEKRGGRLGAIRSGAKLAPLKWTILARYLPAPFVIAPMVLAAAGVPLGTTMLGSAIGMAPWTVAYLWAAKTGSEGSLAGLGRAVAGLLVFFLFVRWVRKRALTQAAAAESGPLKPRQAGRPLVRLYTLPGQELSDEARLDLAGLRDELGFEVDEQVLDGSEGPELAKHREHAPLAWLGEERLFNYVMDENVLRQRLGKREKA